MKKLFIHKNRQDLYRVLLYFFLFFNLLCIFYTYHTSKDNQSAFQPIKDETYLIPCGLPVGIYVETKGILVLETQIIPGADGLNYEPAKDILKEGDYILSVNGETVTTKENLQEAIQQSEGKTVKIGIRRGNKKMDISMKPLQTQDGSYKIGAWIRDDTQGLGTITYINGNRFGALGHSINDSDIGTLMEIEGGSLYQADIFSVKKGENGTPGELIGQVQYREDAYIGKIEINNEAGIYGTLECKAEELTHHTAIPAAAKREVKKGKAYLRFTMDGQSKDYEIKIKKLNTNSKNKNQGILFEVVDEGLLEKTGGVVQGMSGSPVIQNGRIVGAVTHVLVNDPTRGYGIFIENMLEAAE